MSIAYYLAKRIHFSKGDDSQRVSPPAIRIAISGVAIGVAVMLITVAIVVGFKEEVCQKVIDFSGHLQMQAFVSNNTYELPPVCVSDTMLSFVERVAEVEQVERFVTKPAVIKTDNDFLSVVVKGVEEDGLRGLRGSKGLRGSEWSERDVALSKTIADKLKLKVGDQATFYFVQTDKDADPFALGAENTKVKVRKLNVRDIYETHFSEIDQQMVIGSMSLLQQVSGWDDDMYSAVSLTLKDFDQMDDACWLINRLNLVDRQGVQVYVQTVEELNPTVFAWLALLDTNVWVILILIAVVAAFTMISGLLIIILERTQMIGILKAQGMDNRTLRKVFLWVALFLTGKGMLWGNLIGLVFCFVQWKWHVIGLDPANYYLEWVPIHLPLSMFILINVGTIIITLLVLIGPSALVARIAPTKAIQSE
ncbi:MAG: ABC transporter permease [Bacteroidales bacterium]|nr:ABC transporter permease [Bacteroidales bacterium]